MRGRRSDEFAALRRMADALDVLDAAARMRVLDYLMDREEAREGKHTYRVPRVLLEGLALRSGERQPLVTGEVALDVFDAFMRGLSGLPLDGREEGAPQGSFDPPPGMHSN